MYNFINQYVFGLEVAAIENRCESYRNFVWHHMTDPEECCFLLEHIGDDRRTMNRAVEHFMYQQRPREGGRSRLVPTLQTCVLRVLMHDYNLHDMYLHEYRRAKAPSSQ